MRARGGYATIHPTTADQLRVGELSKSGLRRSRLRVGGLGKSGLRRIQLRVGELGKSGLRRNLKVPS